MWKILSIHYPENIFKSTFRNVDLNLVFANTQHTLLKSLKSQYLHVYFTRIPEYCKSTLLVIGIRNSLQNPHWLTVLDYTFTSYDFQCNQSGPDKVPIMVFRCFMKRLPAKGFVSMSADISCVFKYLTSIWDDWS